MQVIYKKKVIKNLGNYESIAVEIGIEYDVDRENETFEDVYTKVRDLVNLKLKNEFGKIRGK